MMQSLRDALWASEAPPGSEAARERTVRLAVERLAPSSDTRRSAPLRPRRIAIAVAAIAVLVLAATPQGRDAVSRAAEWIGIGEVGGPPTKPSKVGQFTAAGEQIVLATGETADRVAFEIVAYRSDRRIEGTQETTVCVNTEFPRGESDSSGSCYAGALRYGGLCCSQVFVDDPATAVPYIEGQISPRVERVSVTYSDQAGDRREVSPVIGMITPKFATALGIEYPSGLFVASLPGLAKRQPVAGPSAPGPAHPIRVTAFGGNGEPIETETYPAAEGHPAATRTSKRMLEARTRFREQCLDEDPKELSPACRELFEAGLHP